MSPFLFKMNYLWRCAIALVVAFSATPSCAVNPSYGGGHAKSIILYKHIEPDQTVDTFLYGDEGARVEISGRIGHRVYLLPEDRSASAAAFNALSGHTSWGQYQVKEGSVARSVSQGMRDQLFWRSSTACQGTDIAIDPKTDKINALLTEVMNAGNVQVARSLYFYEMAETAVKDGRFQEALSLYQQGLLALDNWIGMRVTKMHVIYEPELTVKSRYTMPDGRIAIVRGIVLDLKDVPGIRTNEAVTMLKNGYRAYLEDIKVVHQKEHDLISFREGHWDFGIVPATLTDRSIQRLSRPVEASIH